MDFFASFGGGKLLDCIDSHCHLDYFQSPGEVVTRAKEAGVRGMLTIGTTLASWAKIYGIVEEFSEVWGTIGLHPCDAAEVFCLVDELRQGGDPLFTAYASVLEGLAPPGKDQEAWVRPDVMQALENILADRLVKGACHPKIVGFGETGLDFFRPRSDFEKKLQVALFWAHIEAHKRTGLPLVIHTRGAPEETLSVLKAAFGQETKRPRGVIHCFTEDMAFAEAVIPLGFLIGFSGIVTFKKAEAIQGVARSLDLKDMLLETDAPFLAPVPMRGKTNEPAFVKHTAQWIAQGRQQPLETILEQTKSNFFSLFQKASPGRHASDYREKEERTD